ncbi:hypothetical protein E2C01_099386 [Portunus trituberculatus]|uniref:Uncharacterized protein n=1 Tax=Portunus trituberculatus TaxID=210409 RepID=A0A5B7KA81_PORTR|nr:hypothetical protein [Portunus trituberculatus]
MDDKKEESSRWNDSQHSNADSNTCPPAHPLTALHWACVTVAGPLVYPIPWQSSLGSGSPHGSPRGKFRKLVILSLLHTLFITIIHNLENYFCTTVSLFLLSHYIKRKRYWAKYTKRKGMLEK